MKIAVFGGTGMIGSRVVAEARSRGHEVTAFSRRGRGRRRNRGRHRSGAGRDGIAADHDVIVSALGPSREPGGDPSTLPADSSPWSRGSGSTRVIVVGGAGSLLVAPDVRLVDTPEFPAEYKAESLAAAAALEALRALGPETNWTFLSPAPVIAPGERTASYVLGTDEPVGSQISAEDFAVALVDEVETAKHERTRFTVAN